ELELEFRAGNRHIDPRYGISVFGQVDADSPAGPRQIPIALGGPAHAVDGIRSWLQRCQDPIEAKETKSGQANLHQPFPSFSGDSPFGAQLVFDDALVRETPERQLRRLARLDIASATADAVELYAHAARSLGETGDRKSVVCARPEELRDREDHLPSEEVLTDRQEEQGEQGAGGDFHDLLKA